MTTPVLGLGATFDGGRYRQGNRLRGHNMRGIYAGQRVADQLEVLITVRSHSWKPELVDSLRFDVPGVMPFLYYGRPDGYEDPKPNVPEKMRGIVEQRPLGAPMSNQTGPMHPHDIVRVALGLMKVLAASKVRHVSIQGIRPETVYVSEAAAGLSLAGIAPRAVRVLGYQHDPPYGDLFDGHSYDAPEVPSTLESSATSDLFSCALTLWFAFTRKHAYRVSPNDVDEWVMRADDRGPFSGPPELARILEPVLVADVARRPSVEEVASQFTDLGRQWEIETPLAPWEAAEE